MNLDYVVLPLVLGIVALAFVTFTVRRFRALRNGQHSKRRRLSERIALSIACLLVVVLAATSLFNAVAVHLYSRSHPPAGQLAKVGQYTMHINCIGHGSPVLVLESGLGDDSLVWANFQPQLAQTTEICSYDRAGFGWSDTRPAPRDADHIATELHQLLVDAAVTDPIILMGHSIAGLYIRDYASHYPSQVAGLIFVDGSSPFQDKNPALATVGNGPPAPLIHALLVSGIPRVIGLCSGGNHDAGYAFRKDRAEHVCSLHFNSVSAELNSFDASSQQVLQSATYGNIPILVISHDPAKQLPPHPAPSDIAAQKAWSGMQSNLKSLSTNSRQIIATGSGHYVMIDRPDLLEKEVPLFIQSVRGTAPPAIPNGATITE
ncbi:MAG TPA: alpha/beta hydrolase [Acidobacteriaceae bacterium]|jgi:pimeloyl-ACP methyl ester carboxylesterase